MAFDSLAALRAAGNPVDLLSKDQQDVFAQLTEDEVSVLNSIKRRLDDLPGGEVEAHSGLKIL
jgi:hypothetical protein